MKQLTMMASLLLAATASAAVPFQTTTVTGGKFADNTKWYTMQVARGSFYLQPDGVNSKINLSAFATFDDSDLWCFTGNETDGFTIYNKAYGPSVKLGAPSNPASDKYGDNGHTAYAEVMEPGLAGYRYVWNITESTAANGAYFISLKDNDAFTLNNRDGVLAFWTKGKDAGSSFFINPAAVEPTVTGNVWTLQADPEVTLSSPSGATISEADGIVSLGDGEWVFNLPEGLTLDRALLTTATGEVSSIDGYPYEESNFSIQGPLDIASLRFATIVKAEATPHGTAVFRYDTRHPKFKIVYRIPAITCIENGEHAGRLVALNDYRYCGGDIGGGRIDLHISISDDNGLTWSKPDDMRNAEGKPVARGTGAPGEVITNLDCGFGDPAIVSDRETGELFAIACCGRMNFWNGRRDNPQPSARWWSKDGGKTWTEPDYGQWEQIYALFDGTCKFGYIDSQFVGSGRMVQSKRIKVGDNYRIYCVMSGYNASAGNTSNWVLYSDDLGHNWHVLGDPMNPAVSVSADEPKCEELPDGSVLLAARRNGGNRNFNIFRYTDVAKGEGTWGQHISTNMGMGNINACNGEIMILPVKNVASGDRHYLALQSFPYGGGRNNVSIAWKALVNADDYDEPSDFNTWGGRYQVSDMPSAYSTMCLQKDGKIGFIFEESTFNNNGYTEMYYPISIETITDGAYEYCPDPDFEVANKMAEEMMTYRVNGIQSSETGYVGTVKDFDPTNSNAAIASFVEEPSLDAIASFNSAIAADLAVSAVKPIAGKYYHFVSAHDGEYSYTTDRYLSITKSSKEITTATKASKTTVFRLDAAADGESFLIFNPNAQTYLPATSATTETKMKSVDATQAAPYSFVSRTDGHTAIVCTTPGNGSYPALHMKSSGGNVVIWTEGAGGSQWYMSETELPEELAIEEITSGSADPEALYDLQGRRVAAPVRGHIYVTSSKSKIVY